MPTLLISSPSNRPWSYPACLSCGRRIWGEESPELTEDGKRYRIKCSNPDCKHPSNEYDPMKIVDEYIKLKPWNKRVNAIAN
ncbi:MAG TPA: hypothetical protein VF397_05860 [Pyrinomonadaceae bacterium]